MSRDIFVCVWSNKRVNGDGFLCPPDLAATVRNPRGEASACMSSPLTAKTGAQLRALADEADALWTEYTASLAKKTAAEAQAGGEA